MELIVKIKKRLHQFNLEAHFKTDSPLALLGASGSGKSMTLKCIAGIEKPDEGIIVLNGRTLFDSEKGINLTPQKRNVGYLFQNYALFSNMTVRENISVSPKSNKNKADKLIEEFYLSGLENKYPHEISGGQQQRTALARIIASEPEAILLDEPFSAIDSHMRWNLEMTVSDIIKNFGGITVMVTHDKNEAYRNCPKICIINDGKTEDIICSKQFISSPQTVAAAKIAGCKNIFKFNKTKENSRIFIPNLNIYIITADDIIDDRSYIGINSQDFSFEENENGIKCVVERVTEDINSTILMLKPLVAEKNSEALRVDINNNKGLKVGDTVSIYISPKNVLLLK